MQYLWVNPEPVGGRREGHPGVADGSHTSGEALFDQVIGEGMYKWLGEEADAGGVVVYMFASLDGKRLRAHCDSD